MHSVLERVGVEACWQQNFFIVLSVNRSFLRLTNCLNSNKLKLTDLCSGTRPGITIEPALAVSRLFSLNCRIDYLLPAAYYLACRFENDFEMAVLSAINGGGNNMARAALTGALSGAMVGLNGIPRRFITGLIDHERILGLVDRVVHVGES